MRPAARPYDETEHQVPWDFVNTMWDESLRTGVASARATAAQASGGRLAGACCT